MNIKNVKDAIIKDVEEYPKSTQLDRCKRLGVSAPTLKKHLTSLGLLKKRIKRGGLPEALLEDLRLHPISTDKQRAERLGSSRFHINKLRLRLNIPQKTKKDLKPLLLLDIKEYAKSTNLERSIRLKTYYASVFTQLRKLESAGIIKKLEDGSYIVLKDE